MTLAQQLKNAEGPSRELDALIARALGWQGFSFTSDWMKPDRTWAPLPAFTSDYETLMRTIPPAWDWVLAREYSMCQAHLSQPAVTYSASTPLLALAAAFMHVFAQELERCRLVP